MLPPLGLELKLLIVTGNEHLAELFFGDVADEFDAIYLLDLSVVADRHGEQQFVVFAAIEGTSRDVHVHFLGHDSRLVVDGNILLIDTAANMLLFADMHQF